ncbi:MAG: HPP family protein [Acetobacteraceae bacterium]|nr:HPP family protein [Acetobacteraceae bacterium]
MSRKILPSVVATVSMVAIALLAVWMQQGLLVPSLGSAVFTQVFSPEEPAATPYRVGVGQVIGVAAGFGGVYAAGSAWLPEFTAGHPLVYGRVLAVLIAIPVCTVLQMAFKATSPAAGATALVVALGIETPSWAGCARMLVAIVIATALGEAGRLLILREKKA